MSRRVARRRVIVLATVLLGKLAEAAAPPEIRYEDDRLSARIEGVPLDDVLRAVAAAIGIEIVGEPLDDREVSKRFDAVPLSDALKRLIGRQNFVLSYGRDGAPRRLELLGAPQRAEAPSRERALSAVQLLASQPPVTVPAYTAGVLGGASQPLHLVMRSLRSDDRRVRDESARTVLGVIEAKPELLQSVRAMDVGALVQFFRGQAGPHTDEVVTTLHRAARDPGLRARLGRVNDSLQTARRQGG